MIRVEEKCDTEENITVIIVILIGVVSVISRQRKPSILITTNSIGNSTRGQITVGNSMLIRGRVDLLGKSMS